ncbi:transmembrane emp24 domain-containing protein p24delta3-like [Vicia villosa]|uniref:transmembrane emp24 domain-containing protein p24delta3-like n=1 Tax=Vicia villosa TaxID=3911 RepID=UPI00273B52D6|nr:transmembrane emp24 domain-containing protein p24delta3-like [Vicia villosa]
MAKAFNPSSRTQTALVVLLCFISLFSLPQSKALWLNLPSSGTKCVSQEIQTHVVVLADYYVVAENIKGHPLPTISAKVTSPYGNNLHNNENVTQGQFAFTTTESGNYVACFWMSTKSLAGSSISLDWKTGISAKDWDSVAKQEKIEGVELELSKLDGAVKAIHQNLIYLKNRESEMREVSEATNGRVAWLSIMSLGVCVSVSVLQLWYLRRYFQKKKII